MNNIYAKVETVFAEKAERTDYYITKKENYGVEIIRLEERKQGNFENKSNQPRGVIEKKVNEELNNKNAEDKLNGDTKRVIGKINFDNISNNENVVKSIIDMFISENSNIEQMKYIIDDCIENQKL